MPTTEITIEDTEFFPQNWKVTPLQLTNNATQNSRFGGWIPQGNVRGMQHWHPAAQKDHTHVWVFHEFQGAAYNPAAGELLSIDYSEEQLQFNPPFPGAAIAWAPAIKQNGTVYVGPRNSFTHSTFTNDFNFTPFQGAELKELDEQDFLAFRDGALGGGDPATWHPDFSSSGSEITFGYSRGTSYTGKLSELRDHGIDDWKFVLTVA